MVHKEKRVTIFDELYLSQIELISGSKENLFVFIIPFEM